MKTFSSNEVNKRLWDKLIIKLMLTGEREKVGAFHLRG